MLCWQGGVSLYRHGELLLRRAVFPSPVLGLASTEEVVVVSTYNQILVWARGSLQSHTVKELRVRPYLTSPHYNVLCRD